VFMNSSVRYEANPLNILHLTSSIGPTSGGLGSAVVGFAQEQRLLGHYPAIWTLDPPSSVMDLTQANRLNPLDLSTYPILGPRQVGYSPTMEQAAKFTKGANYDVLHQHSIWLAVSRVTNLWRSTFSRPTIVAPHGTLEEFMLRRSRWKKQLALLAYEIKNLRGAACLHATSVSEAASFRHFGLVNPIAVIPNGISEEWLRNQGDGARFRAHFSLPSNRRLLLFLSRLHPKKGLPLLFEAMAQLRIELSEWFLVIAGFAEAPGYQLELEQFAAKLGITEKVIFVGPLNGQEKRDAFDAADLFILPTHSENFGIVIAEALAAGVPVLTTRGAPWIELVTNKCGWWVDVTVDAVCNALQDAIHRPLQELKEMGQRGKALVEKEYLLSRVAEQTIQIYEWLLGRRRQPDFVIKE
jgi:glycosyltransferase involved in cell wall biosynthesis